MKKTFCLLGFLGMIWLVTGCASSAEFTSLKMVEPWMPVTKERAPLETTVETTPSTDVKKVQQAANALTPTLVMVCPVDPTAVQCYGGHWEYQDADGNVLAVPPAMEEVLSWINPGGMEPTWAFSHDNQWIIYLAWDDGYSVQLFNTQTESNSTLLILNVNSNDAWDTEFFGWNPSDNLVGFVVKSEASDYPEGTKVFILKLDNGTVATKQKYNIPILQRCPGNFCDIRVEWDDDDTLLYQPADSEWADVETFEDCKATESCAKTYEL